MPDKKKHLHEETFFLPPLKMVLSFFEHEDEERNVDSDAIEAQNQPNEKMVTELIEKLSEKENKD